MKALFKEPEAPVEYRITRLVEEGNPEEALALALDHPEKRESIMRLLIEMVKWVDEGYLKLNNQTAQPEGKVTATFVKMPVGESWGTIAAKHWLTQQRYIHTTDTTLATPQPKLKPGDKVKIVKDFDKLDKIGINLTRKQFENDYSEEKTIASSRGPYFGEYWYQLEGLSFGWREDCLELMEDNKAQKLQEWCDRQSPIGQNPDNIATEIHDRDLFDKYKHLFQRMVLVDQQDFYFYFYQGKWVKGASYGFKMVQNDSLHTQWVYNTEWSEKGMNEYYDYKINEHELLFYDKKNNTVSLETNYGSREPTSFCTLNPDKLRY